MIKRTQRELRKKVPVFKSNLELDTEKLHLDLLRKLNRMNKPQDFLAKRLVISRSTLWRIQQNKEIKLSTFLKLLAWLDKDVNTYLIKK